MFRLLPVLALLMAYNTVRMPFEMYFTEATRDRLWTLLAANILAYIMVALNTIRITLEIARREKAKTSILARWAENPVMSKWYAAVKVALKWHLLAAGARMGLAIALAQYFHAVFAPPEDFQGILSPFFYASHDWNVNVKQNPQSITMFVSLLVLCAFAIAETGLLVAITQYVHTFFKRHPVKSAVGSVLLRAMLIVTLAGSMLAFRSVYKTIEVTYSRDNVFFSQAEFRQVLPPLKLAHRPLFALLDNGTMLAAEVMRPIGFYSWFACADEVRHSDDAGKLVCMTYDNLPHVLTWLFLSAIALSFYAALTWLTLRAAMRLHQRANLSSA